MDNSTSFELGGKRYEIDINAYTLEEVRKEVGIDLLKCFEDPTVLERIAEPAPLINAVRIFSDDDCERHGTTGDKDFAKLFRDGDKLREAAECLMNALICFFPSHQRKPLQKLMNSSREAELKLKERAGKMFDDPRIEKLIQSQLTKLDERFTSALESLELQMQADEHSGS